MSDTTKMVEAARAAVFEASGVCRQVQAALDEVRSITKDDKSPVTVADFASQAIVALELRDRLGPITLVAEEASAFLREDDHRPHLEATLAAVREVRPDIDEDGFDDARRGGIMSERVRDRSVSCVEGSRRERRHSSRFATAMNRPEQARGRFTRPPSAC